MKKTILVLSLMLYFQFGFSQRFKQTFVTADLENFWMAYDKIVATKDTNLQYVYLNTFYFDKGSDGLKSIVQARNYTPKMYLDAIHQYPLFWQSIRKNIENSGKITKNVEKAIRNFKKTYPELRPMPIFFTVGAFRTNGTARDNRVLIGTEMAFADNNTQFSELPENLHYFYQNFQKSFETVDLLCTHEYVHTQQNELVENLLSASLYEGVAEFVSSKIAKKPSNAPAIAFGKQHEMAVKQKFEQDMFIPNRFYNWLWSSRKNEFDVRDLAYFIGYEICERNYNAAKNKKQAIKEMIELDFNNEPQIENFIDRTHFFSNSIKNLNENYEKSRPTVLQITEFENNSQAVNPDLTKITLHFSAPMDKNFSGFDFGPTGESVVLRVKKIVGFSADGQFFTFEVELKPNQQYQSLVTNRFRTVDGIPLKPFLIDIKTLEK